MKRLPIFSFFILLTISTLQCQTEKRVDELQRDFARFDAAYLPVLFYAYENDNYQAKRAVFHLEYHWQQLRNRYEFMHPESTWRNAFRRINTQLGDAYTAIDANNQVSALSVLEQVRSELMNLRSAYHINYYLDEVYKFQQAVAILKTTTEDEMLDMMAWEEVMDMASTVEEQWEIVLSQPFDAMTFDFDQAQLWKWSTTIKVVTDNVKKLDEAMNDADRLRVANASERLEMAILEVLRQFGDFDAAASYYAQSNLNHEIFTFRN